MNRAFSPLLAVVLVAACGPRPGAGATSSLPKPVGAPIDEHKVISLEPVRIDVVVADGKTETHAYDARGLLDEGNDALMQRKYDEALVSYEHLIDDFPESKLVVPALYNSGLALEGKSDWQGAIERYRKVMAANPPKDSEDLINAEYRLGAVLAETGRYADSAAVYEKILEHKLRPIDRIEGLARLGFALVQVADYAGAEEILRSALAFALELQATTRLESTYFVAMAQFYLAEIPHRQFAAIPLRYPETQMLKDMDQKSELFLLARDRYVKTVDVKNAYWATAAVFQIGTMYKEYWENWMAVPVPADFNQTEATEYIKQINEQPHLKKLLEKALLFHERNLAMAKEANVKTSWSSQSAVEAENIRQIIARQQRKEYLTPGTKVTAQTPDHVTPSADPSSQGTGTPAPTTYMPGRLEL